MQYCHGKSSIQQQEGSFQHKIELKLRKKPIKFYIWSIALCGAETWTLREVDWKYLESLKYGAIEGFRRSFRSIVWEMQKCYTESSSRGLSCMQ
jgi:hypothetical protein